MTVMVAGAAAKEGAEIVGKKAASSSAKAHAETVKGGKYANITTAKGPSKSPSVKKESKSPDKKPTAPLKKTKSKSAIDKWAPSIRPAKSVVRYRQILIAEFVVCLLLVFTEPAGGEATTPDNLNAQQDFAQNFASNPETVAKTFGDTVEQAAALILVFFLLSVFTVAGPSSARISAALGGVIMLTLMTKQSSPFTRFLPKSKVDTQGNPIADTGVPGTSGLPKLDSLATSPDSLDNLVASLSDAPTNPTLAVSTAIPINPRGGTTA